VPSGPGWIYEIKHDGFRMMVRRDGRPVVAVSHSEQ
jgi:ATP-dependent DNA ligase